MKNLSKFWLGLMVGVLVTTLLLPSSVFAGQAIKLVVNGTEIKCDVPPQNINGRVLVPARFVAEALGATVEWDGENQAVIIKNKVVAPKLDMVETTFKGMKAFEKNGQTYFNAAEYYHLMRAKSIKNDMLYDNVTNTGTIILNGKTTTIDFSDPNNAIQHLGAYYINTRYYQEF